MTNLPPDAGDRRSEPIMLEHPDHDSRGVLENRPRHFFSSRFDLCVDHEARPEAASGGDWGIWRYIALIGIPTLLYSAIAD
ncbi:hypothetical protein [Sphingomonas sp. Y38-1Y]|uniref:hypothetical protein n=1 Tax=Sphingomonas sp. Y38-1Y TaxID=3078265 RepID=UPI0028E7C5EC|nr:hypothetical protein [Sphingomonas sp. Y38-1Y]